LVSESENPGFVGDRQGNAYKMEPNVQGKNLSKIMGERARTDRGGRSRIVGKRRRVN